MPGLCRVNLLTHLHPRREGRHGAGPGSSRCPLAGRDFGFFTEAKAERPHKHIHSEIQVLLTGRCWTAKAQCVRGWALPVPGAGTLPAAHADPALPGTYGAPCIQMVSSELGDDQPGKQVQTSSSFSTQNLISNRLSG